ncbi:MAG: hypothetical protein FIB06_04435 [Betaproteobacteria bacterium]|nr:hypothetical protein [Betaproteobacteria bacterium]
MAANIRALVLAVLVASALSAHGQSVVCAVDYGGERRPLVFQATASPETVPAVAIGSYFLFRAVLRSEPADLAAFKVYIYADRDEGPTPIHQGTWPWPQAAGEPFTGLQRVYEPVRDGELQYACHVKAGP